MDSIPLQTLSRASTISQAPTLLGTDTPRSPARAMVAAHPTDSSVLVIPGQSATSPSRDPWNPQPRTPTAAELRPKCDEGAFAVGCMIVALGTVVGANVGIGVGKHVKNPHVAIVIGACAGTGVGLVAAAGLAAHYFWYAPRKKAQNAAAASQV